MAADPVPAGTDPLEFALRYAGLGLRVVPIKPGAKRPELPAWQDAATVDRTTIEAWWSGLYRGHGVGLALGAIEDYSNTPTYIFAVDVDQHGIDGGAMLADLEAENEPLPDTVEATTGGGGRHLLFTSPVEVRNGKLCDGVDIRGAGGQIVVEPTVHPSGQRYSWDDAAAPWDRDIAPAPAWLLDALTRPVPAPVAPAAKADTGTRPGDRWAAETPWQQILEADGWILHHVDTSGEMHWTRPGKERRDGTSATTGYTANDNLKVFTSSVPQLEVDEVYTKLGYLAAMHHRGDHTAAARWLAEKGYGTAPDDPSDLAVAVAPIAEVAATRNPLYESLLDWRTTWTAEYAAEWIVEPIFAARRSHALYAGAKTGKSYVVLAAVAALATGRPFLDHPGGEPRHVLYVDYEMTPEDVRDRLEEFGYGPDDDLSHLHYAVLPHLDPLDTARGGEDLTAAALDLRAEFVVIDTTSRAVEGEENDANTIRAFYRHTGARLKAEGIGWARLDHAGKDADRGQRGSSAKNDDVDVVWKLTRVDGGHRLDATHRRMSWVPERVVIDSREDHRGVTCFTLGGGSSGWPEGTIELAREMDAAGVPIDAGARRVRSEYGISAKNSTMRAAIKWRQRAVDNSVSDLAGDDTRDHVKARPDSAGRGKTGTAPQDEGRGTENPQNPAGARSGARWGAVTPATDRPSATRSGARGRGAPVEDQISAPSDDVEPNFL